MPLDEAERMKRIAYREYLNDITEKKRYQTALIQYQHNISRSELMRAELLKTTSSVHDIACTACEIISMLTGEENFGKVMRKRIDKLMNEQEPDS